MQKDNPVTLAVIIGAHGVTGEVRLKVFTEDLAAYTDFNGGTLSLKSVRHGSNGMIARIAEVTDRNKAEALRGTELTVPRSALPPLEDGEYYHTDLLGLPAVSTTGEALGHVVAIDDFGAGDVIEIERPSEDGKPGKRFMIPMNADAVPEWDAEKLVVEVGFIV
ncbi:16S rRNA processing protein RimM [Sphingomonas sp. AAP5]|uniref:ribosome maturation factor RimM n=1 Tax=unclassified Sphingomonas TaxID=196159 RepID=UPI001056E4A0|nr:MULTISPECIES: ribosome maturation factor RimM [unclassified Sphingomonas]MDY7522518.1 ribosome maturation factor RimM [Sphingomonas sp. 10B4]MEB0282342.1 ribosome maturation factor RimM [Sphingomonas sp. 10B4]QBM75012.1 16S rRNA processing protein RimM [Sphingomonas sp. AAP5]